MAGFETAANYRFLGLDIDKNMSQTSAVTNDEPSLEKACVQQLGWYISVSHGLKNSIKYKPFKKQDPNTPLRLEPINEGVFLKRMNHHNWLELDCHALKVIKP